MNDEEDKNNKLKKSYDRENTNFISIFLHLFFFFFNLAACFLLTEVFQVVVKQNENCFVIKK